MAMEEVGCAHYKRNCEFVTPCCGKTYRCRFCHDQSEGHLLQRDDVLEVVCSVCSTRQEFQQSCSRCSTVFGAYFCAECKLFDNEDLRQFHCDGCGICRIGGRDSFFHCPTCNMCLPTHLRGKHKCIENISRANCPVCLDDIHTSREPSQIPACSHLIHKSCFEQMIRAGLFVCPVCARSLIDMTEMWALYDRQIVETPMPTVYRDVWAQIYCRDCTEHSLSSYHLVGIKCPTCKGYNTVREKGPLLRKIGDTFQEADLSEDDVLPRRSSSPDPIRVPSARLPIRQATPNPAQAEAPETAEAVVEAGREDTASSEQDSDWSSDSSSVPSSPLETTMSSATTASVEAEAPVSASEAGGASGLEAGLDHRHAECVF